MSLAGAGSGSWLGLLALSDADGAGIPGAAAISRAEAKTTGFDGRGWSGEERHATVALRRQTMGWAEEDERVAVCGSGFRILNQRQR